jgi:hypothetical protein
MQFEFVGVAKSDSLEVAPVSRCGFEAVRLRDKHEFELHRQAMKYW